VSETPPPLASRVVVTALGLDRPGIVAAVTGVLAEAGCNLEDTSMTILGGHFAMMLVVALPDGLATATLEAALVDTGRVEGLTVTVGPLPSGAGGRGGEVAVRHHRLSVYGADHPGIVRGVTTLLAGHGVNIVDLTTRVIGPPERPVYAMLLELQVPEALDTATLAERLAGLADELGVACELTAVDADLL